MKDTERVRLDAFIFDRATGELTRVDDDDASPVRLPPQPARLLGLLVDRAGSVVTREEIRALLWPDVQVEFDQGLHFCVRQIRAALGDRASSPAYIETLPRRGYRLLVTPRPIRSAAMPATPTAPAPPPRRAPTASPAPRWTPRIAAILLLALTTLVGGVLARRAPAPSPLVRLAITSFAPPPDWSLAGDPRRIAEALLLELGRDAPDVDAPGVIGPRTTSAYDVNVPGTLRRMIETLELDYVVNGRFVTAPEPYLLIELIRAVDGVHLWVERFSDLGDPDAIAARVAEGVRVRLRAVGE